MIRWLAILLLASTATAADYAVELVGVGFDRPLYVAAPSTGTKVYVAEQHTGEVWGLDPETGVVEASMYLMKRPNA